MKTIEDCQYREEERYEETVAHQGWGQDFTEIYVCMYT